MSKSDYFINRKSRIRFSVAVVIAFLGILIAFFVFYVGVNDNLSSVREQQLTEVAHQTTSALRLKLNEQQSLLDALGIIVAHGDKDIHSTATLTMLNDVSKKNNIDIIRVTTRDGLSCYANGDNINISDREYFREALDGKSGITDPLTSIATGKQIFVVYAPIFRGGKVIGSVHAACEIDQIMKDVGVNTFGGAGYANIFSKSGDYIYNSQDSTLVSQKNNNWWEFFNADLLNNTADLKNFKTNLDEGKSAFIDFMVNGKLERGYYMPVGINDWYLLQAMPLTVITNLRASVVRLVLILILEVVLLFTSLTAVIVYISRQARKKIITTNRDLGISNEMLTIAFSHISGMVFTYDIENNIIRFESGDEPPFGLKSHNLKAGDIIPKNLLPSDTSDSLVRLFKRIIIGDKDVSGEVKSTFDGKDHWYKVYLTAVYNENKPVRAIGTVENITARVQAQIQFLQEEKFRIAMLSEYSRIYEINLTNDVFRKLDTSSFGLVENEWVPYSQQMARLANDVVYPEDKKVFMQVALRDRLINAYNRGMTELSCEYRTYSEDNSCMWNESTSHLMIDPVSGDLMCFTYANDITKQKNKVSELTFKAERDPLTGLYNRATANSLIIKALDSSTPASLHAFLSIDIDDFKSINDTYGHVKGDVVLNAVARKFETVLRANDILVRMGGDEFAVFLNNITNVEHVKKLALRICERMRTIKIEDIDTLKISVSVGVAIYPSHGLTFDELYSHSDIALYVAKRNGRDRYAIYFPGDSIDENGPIV